MVIVTVHRGYSANGYPANCCPANVTAQTKPKLMLQYKVEQPMGKL